MAETTRPPLQPAPCIGVGLKPAHYQAALAAPADIGFFEVHAENYMGAGGPPHRYLEAIRARSPLSVHGVGLSIGSHEPLDPEHLRRLQQVVARYEPALVSEHLAWSAHDGVFLNDLLPLPYMQETLDIVCAHVEQLQDALGRTVLIENPATYARFSDSTLDESRFLEALAARTGCGLLLDVTNVMVSAVNHGFNAETYLDAFPVQHVREIHLAGFAEQCDAAGGRLLIDDHGSAVRPEVWALYARTIERCGAAPTLIEWDTDVPEWQVLHRQAQLAGAMLSTQLRSTLTGAADVSRVE